MSSFPFPFLLFVREIASAIKLSSPAPGSYLALTPRWESMRRKHRNNARRCPIGELVQSRIHLFELLLSE